MNENSSHPVDAETLAVLKELVRLHADWDKGTAYVPVKFMNDNKAVIARAKAIIARAE